MKLASAHPMFYDFTMDLDNLMVRLEARKLQNLLIDYVCEYDLDSNNLVKWKFYVIIEKLNSNSMASVLPILPQCSENQAITFLDHH